MSLPDEVSASIMIDGMSFEFRARALPQGCARLFPELQCADEFRLSRDLPAAVARAAASALDAAVWKFQIEFEASLSLVLSSKLDSVQVLRPDVFGSAPSNHPTKTQEVA